MKEKEIFCNRMEPIVKFVKMVKDLDDKIGLDIDGNLYDICFNLINEMEEEYEESRLPVSEEPADFLPLIGDWVWEHDCGEKYESFLGTKKPLAEVDSTEYYPKTVEELYDTLKAVYGYEEK